MERSFSAARVEAVNGDQVTVRVDQALVQTTLDELRAATDQGDRELALRYAQLVAQAEALLERRWAQAREQAVQACSGHRAHHVTEDMCYGGCCAGEDCDPRSHGWASHWQVCRCGAERRVNYNQEFVEYGKWGVPR